MLRVLLIKTPL